MDRKKQLLIVLLLGWVALIVYRVATHEPQRHAPLTFKKGMTAASLVSRGPSTPKTSPLKVRLDLLNRDREPQLKVARNLFAPLERPRPPTPPPPPPPSVEAPPPPPPPPQPSPEEIAAQQARLEMSQFRYLGYLNRPSGRHEAFLARGSELFIARQGEAVAGSIRLVEVTPASAVLEEERTTVRVTLTLSP